MPTLKHNKDKKELCMHTHRFIHTKEYLCIIVSYGESSGTLDIDNAKENSKYMDLLIEEFLQY